MIIDFPALSNVAELVLKTGQLTKSSYSITITATDVGVKPPPPPPPPTLPTSAFSVGDSGSFSASVSGQRLDTIGQPINNTSLPDVSGVSDADKNDYQYDIKFSLNVNIDGWERQGAYETKTYEDAEFKYVDTVLNEGFVVDVVGDHSDEVTRGGYNIFSYLAQHYLDREISLGSSKFVKDLGNGYKAVVPVSDIVLTITGGTGNPDTLSYTVKSIPIMGVIVREPN